MSGYLKIYCLVVSLCLYSCNTTKKADVKAVNNTKNESKPISLQAMVDKGFSKGTITTNKSEGCPYILTVEEYNEQLDPINLQDFFTDEVPQKIWVKYSNLRMKNRCNEGRPVSITEMSKRDD